MLAPVVAGVTVPRATLNHTLRKCILFRRDVVLAQYGVSTFQYMPVIHIEVLTCTISNFYRVHSQHFFVVRCSITSQ